MSGTGVTTRNVSYRMKQGKDHMFERIPAKAFSLTVLGAVALVGLSTGCEDNKSSSGLVWQNPAPDDLMYWQEAIDYCENLTLDGHDDWRLPTIDELRSLVRGCQQTEPGGGCEVTESCLLFSCWDDNPDPCYGCPSGEGPDNGCYWPAGMDGPCDYYWSSSPVTDDNTLAWNLDFYSGEVEADGRTYDAFHVRCVR